MSENRGGSPVVKPDIKGTRKSFKVLVHRSGTLVVVDNAWIFDINVTLEQAFAANQMFVQELSSLSEILSSRAIEDLSDPENLKKALSIDKITSQEKLDALQAIGSGIRSELSDELVNAFRVLGFLRERIEEEPALTFQEMTIAPILWEMMYEYDENDQIGCPDWRRFWGFRIPITHWKDKNRTSEIWLKQGLFSATSEDLRFANEEVELLVQHVKKLQLGQIHSSLETIIREHVDEDLPKILEDNVDSVETWWKDCRIGSKKTEIWLKRFLGQLIDNDSTRAGEVEQWKEKVLKHIFDKSRAPYDLIHFACHCETSEKSEFLSRLEMKVAGEKITLDVSQLAISLSRKNKWNEEEPGPLVFLNACGSGQQRSLYAPPGFPDKWIKNQGALAVIATLCPVPDFFAHAFAKKFYETLFDALSASEEKDPDPTLIRNCNLAEALLTTRCYFMEQFNNPLGLAYVLYTTSGAHVQANLAKRGDES